MKNIYAWDGNRITTAYKAANMKRDALAANLGVAYNQICNWESSKNPPKVETLFRIVELTGCDLLWLITGEEQERVPLNAEKRALQLRDVDMDRGHLTVQRSYRDSGAELKAATKTGASRVLPISDELIPVIRARLQAAVGAETTLFPSPSTGRAWDHTTLSGVWRAAAKKIGAGANLYQGTRHSVASQALNRGVSEMLIKAALGHTNLSTTAGYAHAAPEKLRQLFNGEILSLRKKAKQ